MRTKLRPGGCQFGANPVAGLQSGKAKLLRTLCGRVAEWFKAAVLKFWTARRALSLRVADCPEKRAFLIVKRGAHTAPFPLVPTRWVPIRVPSHRPINRAAKSASRPDSRISFRAIQMRKSPARGRASFGRGKGVGIKPRQRRRPFRLAGQPVLMASSFGSSLPRHSIRSFTTGERPEALKCFGSVLLSFGASVASQSSQTARA